MRTDALIREEGIKILYDKLGSAEAGRFMAIITREPFDYTEWRRNLYDDMTDDEFFQAASEFCTKNTGGK